MVSLDKILLQYILSLNEQSETVCTDRTLLRSACKQGLHQVIWRCLVSHLGYLWHGLKT